MGNINVDIFKKKIRGNREAKAYNPLVTARLEYE